MSDTLTPGIGTKLYVAATTPATEDATGYAAMTWVEVGEISEIPEFGPEYSEVNFTPLATGIKAKYHGELDYGSISLPFALSAGDAGQAALKTAMANKARISFKVEFPKLASTSTAGPIVYTQGKAFSFTRSASTGDVVSGSLNVGFERPLVEVPEVTA